VQAQARPFRRLGLGSALLAAAALLVASAWAAPLSRAASPNPLAIYFPEPLKPTPKEPTPQPIPPPNSYLNGPCGAAVDSGGRIYLADHYHDGVDVFSEAARKGFLTQAQVPDAAVGPCAVGVGPTGDLYVADYHGAVSRYVPGAYPPVAGPHPPNTEPPATGGTTYAAAGVIDPGQATGLAVDGAGKVYVSQRDRVSVYGSGGAPQADIGVGDLGDAYGVAVSGFAGTAGDVYVADASTGTVKVFDSAGNALVPIGGPPGGFTSLRDTSIAVDNASGEVYVVDNTQPGFAEQPRGRVYVFSAAGVYEGHLLFDVLDGSPSGLAVDNSGGATQGRVYVTTGNSHYGGLYVYGPAAATNEPALAPKVPPAPLIGGLPIASIDIGAAASSGSQIPCSGDSCRSLPPEPVDPTLTTLLEGPGNPKVHYQHNGRGSKHRRKRHHRAHLLRAPSSAAAPGSVSFRHFAPSGDASATEGASSPAAATRGLLPGLAGFAADVRADGGRPATQAGSHPYELALHVGLDQSGGGADLRDLRIDLPPGFLVNPVATALCSSGSFDTQRSSPFESSDSGESCPDRSQVGTLEVATGGGQTRRFGLFDLVPTDGTAARFGAAPFGQPLVFDGTVRGDGEALTLQATDIPQALAVRDLDLVFWGAPWAASHNSERGNCLNEAEPGFPWSRCSVGEPLANPPLASLTIPTECASALAFMVAVRAWGEASEATATALNLDAAEQPALLQGCSALAFKPTQQAFLTTKKASSASGFGFQLSATDPGLLDPALRIAPPTRRIVLHLPAGVTINPSVGAGLGVCTPAQLEAESPSNPVGAGCPNDSQLGTFRLGVPFYQGFLDGSIYLAAPDDPKTSTPGAENPFDTLIAVYLIAKSAQRGILVRVPGVISADPTTGNLIATFDHLPQLPYVDLDLDFHAGQRSLLVSPPACGPAVTKTQVTPWSGTSSLPPPLTNFATSPIESGSEGAACPSHSTPPFNPGAVTGGVNANVGSYTPYFIHLSRRDTEQEITSYSLALPKGITGKLAGLPLCSDQAIEAARHNSGFPEIADSSCPAASEVGHTVTGYGVGAALTYAPGRIYLAGPYHGSPLSLVTVNAATVGPFDLGTIVIRSAFDVDTHTAQLQIDSRASDPIPHIIDGIVLHLRDIRIYMDRPQFTHNPSSCDPSQLESTLTGSGASFASSADDSATTVAKHFQLLNCLTVGFKPKLGLRLRGGTHRGDYPELRASFVSRGPKDSNLKRIAVTLPHSTFFAQEHIDAVCTRVQFAAERCPEGSVYGKAVADTSLFDTPLRGNVYLRSSSNQLPDLVADLHSGEVRIIVEGRIGPSKSGGIRTFFDNLPDAPIERFTMTLFGGRRGLLVNSTDICKAPPLASVKALGQNNVGAVFNSTLRGSRCNRGSKRLSPDP
jgi:sugar lactone lactonase YvrE